MLGESHNASPGRGDLGELLVLLHGGDVPANTTIQVTYRVWRHQERLHAAFRANAEEQQRRGASMRTFSLGRGTPQPTELEETVQIWRDGNRARVEHHGGPRDGYYAVADGRCGGCGTSGTEPTATKTIPASAVESGRSFKSCATRRPC